MRKEDIFTKNMFSPEPGPGDKGYLPPEYHWEGQRVFDGAGNEYDPYTLEIMSEATSPEFEEALAEARRQLTTTNENKIREWAGTLLRRKRANQIKKGNKK